MQSVMRTAAHAGRRAAARAATKAPAALSRTEAQQVRFNMTSIDMTPEPLIEGGLRGVVGTVSLVEKDALYVEAWVPDGEGGLVAGDAWTSRAADKYINVRRFHEDHAGVSSGFLADAYSTMETTTIEQVTEADIPGSKLFTGSGEGYAAVAIPVSYGQEVTAVFMLVYRKENAPNKTQLGRLHGDLTVAVAHIMEGAAHSVDQLQAVRANEEVFDAQRSKVVDILKKEGVFSDSTIDEEVHNFYTLGLSPLYFAQNNPVQIARHITGFIGARKTVPDMEDAEPDYGVMTFQFIGKKDATFFCLDELDERNDLWERLNEYKKGTPEGEATSVTLFRTTTPLLFGKSLLMVTATRSRYLTPPAEAEAASQTPPDLWKCASASFLRSKSKRTRTRYQEMLKTMHGRLSAGAEIRERDPGYVVMLAFPEPVEMDIGMRELFAVLDLLDLQCDQFFVETFNTGMTTYNVYLRNSNSALTEKEIRRNLVSLTRRMTALAVLPAAARSNEAPLGPRAKLYLGCAQAFTYHFMPQRSEDFIALRDQLQDNRVMMDRLDRMGRQMQKHAVTINRFNATVEKYPKLATAVYNNFVDARKPGSQTIGRLDDTTELEKLIKNTVEDPLDEEIFLSCLLFNRTVLKTNFFSREKAATSFRLDPAHFISPKEYPEVPFGVFMVVGANFEGFHIRFRDIGRGGIRMIKSPNASYFRNQQTLFEENYNLAYTQQLKNKDIPEAGSKGTILLNPDGRAQADDLDCYYQYIDSLLDLIIPNDNVVDLYGKTEYLFFGPDEGTAGENMVVWAAEHARKRGYRFWKSVTTGKPATMGGIPHDRYGMTTRSVHQNVLGVLRVRGMNEEDVTKVQTGGPDGDLGSNEILISKDKTIAICDGAGVVFDPEGLNREEIARLAHERVMIDHFDTSKLGSQGYRVLITDHDVTLPDGRTIESGLVFRNEFHLDEHCTADLFVPCGGRPNSVNINNVHRMFKKDGTPRFPHICEGANLFITRDARAVLEDAGVVLLKDATCNKGGVTSSSLEVLAALAMDEEQHNKLMCVKPDGTVPEFYSKYVVDVQNTIEDNARLEFEACWREREAGTHKYMVEITDLLSKKINNINDMLQNSGLLETNQRLREIILEKALPPLLVGECGMPQILERVPKEYLDAICGAYFASRYVYKYGLAGSEVQILDFVQEFVKFQE